MAIEAMGTVGSVGSPQQNSGSLECGCGREGQIGRLGEPHESGSGNRGRRRF